jgi:hypothetical protein
LKIYGGFPPPRCQQDNLIQIGISLKSHDHERSACR